MKRILIIDDDKDIAEVVEIMLTMNGFAVHTHATGYSVPELVKKYEPHLILLDVNLPGKTGTEICSELKSLSNLPPILLFSAHAKQSMADACKADGFVAKPFDIASLIYTIGLHTN